MLSNFVNKLTRNIFHGNVAFFFTACFLQLLLSEASPVSKASGSWNGGCPDGWLYDRRFCVARGEGSTDRAVAYYCATYGGIGIKGLCIIRAPAYHQPSLDAPQGQDSSSHESSVDMPGQRTGQSLTSLGQELQRHESLTSQADGGSLGKASHDSNAGDLLEDDKVIDQAGCSKGWIHYRYMCVYQPAPIKEICYQLGAVEFNGLCIKHADTKEIARQGHEHISKSEKRVCCCSHINAKANGYGCI